VSGRNCSDQGVRLANVFDEARDAIIQGISTVQQFSVAVEGTIAVLIKSLADQYPIEIRVAVRSEVMTGRVKGGPERTRGVDTDSSRGTVCRADSIKPHMASAADQSGISEARKRVAGTSGRAVICVGGNVDSIPARTVVIVVLVVVRLASHIPSEIDVRGDTFVNCQPVDISRNVNVDRSVYSRIRRDYRSVWLGKCRRSLEWIDRHIVDARIIVPKHGLEFSGRVHCGRWIDCAGAWAATRPGQRGYRGGAG
jgi:hypothetical protein